MPALGIALLATGWSASSDLSSNSFNQRSKQHRSRSVSALSIHGVSTPPLRVHGFDTSGTYPQVQDGHVDLRAVNAALREAVLADQRAYTPYARADRKRLERYHRPELYEASARNYRQFALTPEGLAVGVNEIGACGNWQATVPYRILRPYLSELGAELIAGVHRPL